MTNLTLHRSTRRDKKMPVAEIIALGAVFAYPALTLTVQGGVNTAMAVIFLAAMFILFTHGRKFREHFSDPASRLFAAAMASGAVAILVNQIAYQHFDPKPFDSELRFLLAIFIFAALRTIRQRLAVVIELAIPIGALVTLLVLAIRYEQNVRLRTDFLDAIHVGEISMLLGFLSLLSINWLRKDGRYMLMLKLVAFLASIYIVIRTGTRGVWLVIPLLLLFGYATQNWRPVSIKTALAVVIGLCVAAYFSVGIVQKRVDLALSNFESYRAGKVENGTAARIELWRVAISLAMRYPVAGIEQGKLPEKLQRMRDAGEINDLVLENGKAEMHSEIAARMAKYGGAGLLSAILVLTIPYWMFLRRMNYRDRLAKGAARMGVMLMLSLFLFGLTVEIFNIKMLAAFYALTISLLMALAYPDEPALTMENNHE